jgi:hypothetical protein
LTYRDDLEAATARAAALTDEVEQLKAENERLRRELDPAAGLHKRAAQGRASNERARETRQKTRETAAEKQNRLWLGRGAMSTGFFNTASFVVTGLFIAGISLIPIPSKMTMQFAWILMPLAAFLFAVTFLVFGFLGKRAAERELAWVASLPFPLEGFAALFADPPKDLNVVVSFQGDEPDEQTMRDLFYTVDPGYSSTSYKKGYKMTICLHQQSNGSKFRKVRHLNLHLHKLVDGALLPLHRANPLKVVRFRD